MRVIGGQKFVDAAPDVTLALPGANLVAQVHH